MINVCQRIYDGVISVTIIIMQSNYCPCQTYDGSNQGYESVPTDIPSGMGHILLRNNEISHINDGSFNQSAVDFSSVYQLSLDRNTIENVSERALMGFQNLRKLHLENNQLKDILLKAEDFPRLQYLYLQNNQFTQMPKFYGFFQYIAHLTIHSNLISYVHENDFENITGVMYITLHYNGLILFEPRHELVRLMHLHLEYKRTD